VTVPEFDIAGGGLRIPGHLVSANPTNVNRYMARKRESLTVETSDSEGFIVLVSLVEQW